MSRPREPRSSRGSRHGPGRARRSLHVVVGATALFAAVVVAANIVVVHRTVDDVTTEVSAVRPAQVAIVPGSLVRADGSLGAIVRERVDAAVELYRGGRVEKLLMSGDNGRREYNEPDAMRDAALAAGVAPEDVFTDYAGSSTWHTMRRAHDVFLVRTAVVVTQAPSAARAADLARAAGLGVDVLVVGSGGRAGREVLARVRGIGEATFRPEVVGGPVIPIDGDGRASWSRAKRGARLTTGGRRPARR